MRRMLLSLRPLAVAALASTALTLACSAPPAPAPTPAPSEPAAARFDVVIANGRVVDGTGAPWFTADVGIRGGQIAALGDLRAA